LEETLTKVAAEFQEDTADHCYGILTDHCTPDDVEYMVDRIYNALEDFKESIIEYLKKAR